MNAKFWVWFLQFFRFSIAGDDGGGGTAVDRGDTLETSGDSGGGDDAGETDVKKLGALDESEPEPESEPESEDEDESKSTGKKDNKLVPRARLNEATRKLREQIELRDARVAELERQLQSVSGKQDASKIEGEIDALEEQLDDARADGNKDRVKQLREAIRLKNKQLVLAEAKSASRDSVETAREEIRSELMIETYETQFPELNSEHEDYDEDLVEMINDLRNGNLTKGMSLSAALKSAVEKTMRRLGRMGDDGKPIDKKAKDDTPKGKAKDAEVREQRKAESVKRAATAAAKQPLSLGEVGDASDSSDSARLPNIMEMSAAEYAALPEATRRRLRGDEV